MGHFCNLHCKHTSICNKLKNEVRLKFLGQSLYRSKVNVIITIKQVRCKVEINIFQLKKEMTHKFSDNNFFNV